MTDTIAIEGRIEILPAPIEYEKATPPPFTIKEGERTDKYLIEAIGEFRRDPGSLRRIKYALLYIAKYNLIKEALEMLGLKNLQLTIEDAYGLLVIASNFNVNEDIFQLLSGKRKNELIRIIIEREVDGLEYKFGKLNNRTYSEIVHHYLYNRPLKVSRRGYMVKFSHPYNAMSYMMDGYNFGMGTINPYYVNNETHTAILINSPFLEVLQIANADNISKIREKLGILHDPKDEFSLFGDARYAGIYIREKISSPPNLLEMEEIQQGVLRHNFIYFTDREFAELYGASWMKNLDILIILLQNLKLGLSKFLIKVKDNKYIYAHAKDGRLHGDYYQFSTINDIKVTLENIVEIVQEDNNITNMISVTYNRGIMAGWYSYRRRKRGVLDIKLRGFMINGAQHGEWIRKSREGIKLRYYIIGNEVSKEEYSRYLESAEISRDYFPAGLPEIIRGYL